MISFKTNLTVFLMLFCAQVTRAQQVGIAYTLSRTASSGPDEVRLMGLDGTDLGALVSPTMGTQPYEVQQQLPGDQILWTDTDSDGFYIADADGSNESFLFGHRFSGQSNAQVQSFSVNESRIYWGDSLADEVRVADMNGMNARTVSSGSLAGDVVALQLDADRDRLIWSSASEDAIVEFDLTTDSASSLFSLEDAFGAGNYVARGLQVGPSKIYGAEQVNDFLFSVDLDGSNPEVLFDVGQFYEDTFGNGSSQILDTLLVDSSLFWSETSGDRAGIYRLDLQTQQATRLLDTFTLFDGDARGLTFYSAAVPEPNSLVLVSIAAGAIAVRRRRS